MTATSFDFASSAGYQLAGRLELPTLPVRGWTLFAHCFTCGKDNLAAVRIARALDQRGIGMLRFDFAGLGKSGGDFGAGGFGADVADLAAAGRAMGAHGMPPGGARSALRQEIRMCKQLSLLLCKQLSLLPAARA
jgi:hypothetical protein